MYELFRPFGNLLSVRIMVEKETGRSRGFGFVSYDSPESAALAINKLNGCAVGNKRLKVQHKQIRASDHRHPAHGVPRGAAQTHAPFAMDNTSTGTHPPEDLSSTAADLVSAAVVETGNTGYDDDGSHPHEKENSLEHRGGATLDTPGATITDDVKIGRGSRNSDDSDEITEGASGMNVRNGNTVGHHVNGTSRVSPLNHLDTVRNALPDGSE